MNLQSSIVELKGIGPKSAEKFHKLDIYTIEDLLLYYPFRYEDFKSKSVFELEDGELRGLDEALEPVVKKYKGLFVEKKDTNEGGGEPAVVKTSAKAVNKSGITFSVTNKSVAPIKNKVQGIAIK